MRAVTGPVFDSFFNVSFRMLSEKYRAVLVDVSYLAVDALEGSLVKGDDRIARVWAHRAHLEKPPARSGTMVSTRTLRACCACSYSLIKTLPQNETKRPRFPRPQPGGRHSLFGFIGFGWVEHCRMSPLWQLSLDQMCAFLDEGPRVGDGTCVTDGPIELGRPSSPTGQRPNVCSCAGFSDAEVMTVAMRSDGRRPRSAKARNRGMWGVEGAAGSMAI